jgi:hypothetical protein
MFPALLWAGEDNLSVLTTQDTGLELQLEARAIPLAKILRKITEQTGVPIHYTVLPQGLISATCVGTTVKQVLECLVNKKADLIFKYPPKTGKGNHLQQPQEVWVLGTNFDSTQKDTENCQKVESKLIVEKQDVLPNKPENRDQLLEIAKTGDAKQRLDAVSQLAIQDRHNEAIREALETASSDKDASVRAQAVFGMSRREGSAAVLQNALHDSDVSVRLMAVDSMDGNAILLQQAVNDSDETVRELAKIKLQALSKEANAQ